MEQAGLRTYKLCFMHQLRSRGWTVASDRIPLQLLLAGMISLPYANEVHKNLLWGLPRVTVNLASSFLFLLGN
jgi:hypothetical protein